MVKWKIFSKSKEKEEDTISQEETPSEEKTIPEEKDEENSEDKPIAVHHEVLYSDDSKKKKKTRKKISDEQYIWRDTDKIEKKVDNLHIDKAKKPSTKLDKKVDILIEKNKKIRRKPSNVIYVVNDPQPGQVKGDWAVRGHGKIYSHHRTKENAIKKAREVARERDATVMVQNTDGTFSDVFKPRK